MEFIPAASAGLNNLPAELLYELQLFALSEHLPHVSRHLYQVFKSAPPSFHAQYIWERTGDPNLLTIALRYPICTIEVFDALCRHSDSARLQRTVTEIPRRFFRSLTLDGRPSERTEHHHPLPFLRHLFDNASVTASDIYDYPLIQAGRAGFLPLLLFLYQHLEYSPSKCLCLAAKYGHDEVVKLFLAHGDVDVNEPGTHGLTPLSWAAGNGHTDVVTLLLARDDIAVDPVDCHGRRLLSRAAFRGHTDVVALLLARDDVDVDSADIDGRTTLSLAAFRGHTDVVALLLARDDVDVDSLDKDGRTPLSLAAFGGHAEVVILLLARHDINVNSKDRLGATPGSWAAIQGHKAVVELLGARRT